MRPDHSTQDEIRRAGDFFFITSAIWLRGYRFVSERLSRFRRGGGGASSALTVESVAHWSVFGRTDEKQQGGSQTHRKERKERKGRCVGVVKDTPPPPTPRATELPSPPVCWSGPFWWRAEQIVIFYVERYALERDLSPSCAA